MIDVYVEGLSIDIGRQGENLARNIYFDLSELISTYGEGTATLVHMRPSDQAPYVCTVTRSDTFLIWAPTSTDTAYSGSGKCELRWVVGDTLAKSIVYRTSVTESITGDSTVPSEYESWYEALLEHISEYEIASDQITANTSQITENTSDIAVLEGRMDEFAKLPDGSTAGDAELADIRVGADGTQYETAGEAVRQQISDLKADLNEKIDKIYEYIRVDGTSVTGKLISVSTSGVIGEFTAAYGSYRRLAVQSGEIYKVTAASNNTGRPSVVFANSGSFVSSLSETALIDAIITVPSSADTMYLNGGMTVDNVKLMPAALKRGAEALDDYIKETAYTQEKEAVEITPTTGANVVYANGTPTVTESVNYEYVSLPVNAGDKYFVTATGAKATLSIYDSNYYLVSVVLAGTVAANDYEVVIPSNGYYLLVNSYINTGIIVKRRVLVPASGGGGDTYIIENQTNSIETIPMDSRQFWTYLHHDNFHRSDDSTSLGSNGDNNNDMSYTVMPNTKTCGIVNNSAYCGQSNGTCVAVRELGVSDFEADIQIDLSNETDNARGCGMAFRVSDASNFWCAFRRQTFFAVTKYVNGTATRLAYIYAPTGGDPVKKLTVKCSGSRISLSIDGIPYAEITDSFNINATMCGLFWEGNSLGRINYIDVKVKRDKERTLDILDTGEMPFYWASENFGASYSFNFVTDVTNGSERSNRFEVRKDDRYKRSEIKLPKFFKQMGEQVISFDMMLGEDYSVYDPESEIISQFHDSPENGNSSSENAKLLPNLALYIKNGRYIVRQQWDEAKGATPSTLAHEQQTDIGAIANDIGSWVSWVWHVKWSYAEFFEPITELYKNGELVYTSKNPNTVNATNASYFKVGCYQWNYEDNPSICNSTSRTMWVDNIRMIS